MTTTHVLKSLRKAGKPVCLSHFYNLIKKLDIRPLGSSRPQQYPATTPERILQHLGFSAGQVQPNGSLATRPASPKLISVAQLRAAKPKKGTK